MNKIIQMLILDLVILYIFSIGATTILCMTAGIPFMFSYSTVLFICIFLGQTFLAYKKFGGEIDGN